MIYTGYIPLANILKSNPKRSFSSVASQSSFASSRQASASDLLPSPAALATRAQGEGSPPRAAAAPSQRRPLLHHRYQSSRLARHLVASPLLLHDLPDASRGGRQLHVTCSPASAISASAGPARRALRQLRLPRRPSCPPQRRNSWRFRAILSRPDPVK